MIRYRVLIKSVAHLRRAPRGGIKRYVGGQFIDNALWQEEQKLAFTSLPELLDGLGTNLNFLLQVYEQNVNLTRAGITTAKLNIPLSTIEARMKSAIREAYANAYRYGRRGAGNLTSLRAEDHQRLIALRRDEFKYLRKFLDDIKRGRGRMNYGKRMDMYRAATREAFWLGFVYGNTSDTRILKWDCDPKKEHCTDCIAFSNLGQMKTSEFIKKIVSHGYVPQSGKLECMGYRCGCSITEVKK
ncbi:MAG: hypothetical protein ABJA67_13470 [Chthonomonadales bacterium]